MRDRSGRPTVGGSWDGWCASTREVGEHGNTRWPELLAAAAAFHAAVADVPKPEFIERRVDRWRIADRVAWGELPATGVATVTHVDCLLAARQPLDIPSQLVHGDLVGNVLFAEGLPHAIIDLSLYWRPVGYSAALVVVDAFAWEGLPIDPRPHRAVRELAPAPASGRDLPNRCQCPRPESRALA